MTIIVYKKGVILTDSFIVGENGEKTVARLGEKVYKSPCGRWVMTQAGETVDDTSSFSKALAFIGEALSDYYFNGTLLTTSLQLAAKSSYLTQKDIEDRLSDSIVMTKTHCFAFKGIRVVDITDREFWVLGGGWSHAITLLCLGETPLEAINYTAQYDRSCSFPIHTYKATTLKPFKKLTIKKA